MSYKIAFTPQAMGDFNYWKSTNPEKTEKIKILLRELQEHPFSLTGKPEPLDYPFSWVWSRRTNHKDWPVYQVDGEILTLFVLAMRFHYSRQ